MRRRALLAAALLLAWAASARAVDPDAPTVSVRAEKGRVQLGEPFHVWVSVLHRPDVEVNIPATFPPGSAFDEIRDHTSTREREPDGLVRTTFELTVAGFDVGTQAFPALTVGYTVGGEHRELRTDPIEIKVESVIGEAREELKPIAPPVAIFGRDWTLLWIVGGVAVAALLAFGAWTLARRMAARPAAVRAARAAAEAARPPDEVALEKLRGLATSGLIDADDRRPLYFALTEVVREYLGRRWGFDALEQTTSELLHTLDRRAGDLAVRAELAAWLDACDLVKYARVPASREEAERALARAIELVERTRPAPQPVPAPGAPTAPPPAQTVTG